MRSLTILPFLLFGLIFAGAGGAIYSQTGFAMLKSWYQMQSWQPIYAQINSSSGSESHNKASYSYEVNGVAYEGTRVYVADFNDNIGSYHRDMQNRLSHHQRSAKPMTIWIDPSDPYNTVIDRNMRWGLLTLITVFCGVFIVIGVAVAMGGIQSVTKKPIFVPPSNADLREEWEKKKAQSETSFNESFMSYRRARLQELKKVAEKKASDIDGSVDIDWQSKKGWEHSQIRSEAKGRTWMMWGFTVFWNAMSTPIIFIIPKEIAKDNWLVLIALVFPLVGLVLIYHAIKLSLEYRRFGTVLFDMDPYPGSIGGNIGGKIMVTRMAYHTATAADANVNIKLECVHAYMSGSGDSRSRNENIRWAEGGVPKIEPAVEGTVLSFRFDVPNNLPESDLDSGESYHFWRLVVNAEIEGIDLDRIYIIPVFKTAKPSRFVRHDISTQSLEREIDQSDEAEQAISQGNFDLPGLSRAMRVEQDGDAMTMVFPMFRNKALSVFAAIFAGGFGFASAGIINMAVGSGLAGIFFGLFALPFILVALLAGLAVIYLPFNRLVVKVATNRLSVSRSLFYIPVFSRELTSQDISYLSLKRSGSVGQGVDKTEHFKIMAHYKGKTVAIAEDLDGKEVASHFCDYMANKLDVEIRG